MIDSSSVRQGKVGMWCGVKGDLGGRIDSGEKFTEGIFVSGCSYPINDIYGDESCQYIAPRVMNIDTLLSNPRRLFLYGSGHYRPRPG